MFLEYQDRSSFSNYDMKPRSHKEKIDKIAHIKCKNLHTEKHTMKVKR